MKKNLEILEIEPKLDKNEKKYWRVNTSEGWMTCWDSEVCEKLKTAPFACVEITEKEGTNFKGEKTTYHNITGWYDEEDLDKAEVEVVKVGERPKNSNCTMYTSYAKDIFCKLCDIGEQPHNSEEGKTLMDSAIELVKQAKEAFE